MEVYAILYNVLYVALSCGTTSVHEIQSCHFPNLRSRTSTAQPIRGHYQSGHYQFLAIGRSSAHFQASLSTLQTLTSLFLEFFSLILLTPSLFFFLYHHCEPPPPNLPLQNRLSAESLAFAPPFISNNQTTLRAWSTYTTSRRSRCGLQRGCSTQQCSRYLAWVTPAFITLH